MMEAAVMFWGFCIVLTMGMSDLACAYNDKWRRIYRYSHGNFSDKELKRLSKILMLEADGGDDPVEYLRWAIEESKNENT